MQHRLKIPFIPHVFFEILLWFILLNEKQSFFKSYFCSEALMSASQINPSLVCLTSRPHLFIESLHNLEDNDLDALVADLGSKSTNNACGVTDHQMETSAKTQEREPAAAPLKPAKTAEFSAAMQMVI